MFKFDNSILKVKTDILIKDVYCFITKNNENDKYHFYIVNENDDIIELSDNFFPYVYSLGGVSVSDFATDREETVIKIYDNYKDFTITVTENK